VSSPAPGWICSTRWRSCGPELAEAVALRDVLGLPYAEIAALQQVPEGTVKSRIHDARARLRQLLA